MEDRFLTGYSTLIDARHQDSDDALVTAATKGDHPAYEELCRRHSRQVFRAAHRIVGNAADAEDLVQDTFIRAFRHLSSFKRDSAFSTWITSIAINCSLMLLRRRRNSPEGRLTVANEPDTRRFEDPVLDSPSPEDLASEAEIAIVIARGISQLPPSLREVMSVHYYDDASTKEIATLMGLTPSAVKSRLWRARSRLRRSVLNVRPQQRPIPS